MKKFTEQEITNLLEDGFTMEQIQKGYDVFTSEYMNGALHIERLDALMMFNSDREASEQAEKDGIKIIKDLSIDKEDEDFGYYIDTEENRRIIKEHLETRGIIVE